MPLFQFNVTIQGRVRADTPKEVEDQVKAGLALTLPLHDAVDDLVIRTTTLEADTIELERRFT